MNIDLGQLFKDRLVSGLKRQAISKCSQWACMYRVMGQPFPGPFSFKHHPWTRELHDAMEDHILGMKAAQMGFTEVALNKAFYTIDVLASNVLYYLPSATPDASNFSAARFDPALDLSPYLQKLFSDVRNVGHKRAGSANLFIRGTRSRSQAKSVPASLMIFDERDEMNQDIVILARERVTGQNVGQEFDLSTPTVDGFGIDKDWKQSTQEQYYFKCPSCKRMERLRYPESLVVTAEDPNDPSIENSHLICTKCKAVLPNQTKPQWLAESNCEWVPGHSDRVIRGFAISQLYSMAYKARPALIASKSLLAKTNATEEQEFYNSKLGQTHTIEGARVTDLDIIECTKGHTKVNHVERNGWYMMGVDVGPKYLHVEITEYLKTSSKKIVYDLAAATIARVLLEIKVENFEDLDTYMRAFRILKCVIDAQPETRKAVEFSQRFSGAVALCYYAETKNKQLEEKDGIITAGRTVWLDTSLGRYKRRSIELPADTSLEYRTQTMELVRIYTKDQDGNPVGRYVSTNADHFAHARNYCEMALQLSVNAAGNQNITGV
jgi:hypothetical protein